MGISFAPSPPRCSYDPPSLGGSFASLPEVSVELAQSYLALEKQWAILPDGQ